MLIGLFARLDVCVNESCILGQLLLKITKLDSRSSRVSWKISEVNIFEQVGDLSYGKKNRTAVDRRGRDRRCSDRIVLGWA